MCCWARRNTHIGGDMSRIRKRDIWRGVDGAREMLERNASPIDTFEGVLSRRDVRTLKLLIALGEQDVGPRSPSNSPRHKARIG